MEGKKMGLGYHIRISESGKKTNLLIMKEKIRVYIQSGKKGSGKRTERVKTTNYIEKLMI